MFRGRPQCFDTHIHNILEYIYIYFRHLDLLPSLGNLEEETSCCCDVGQSSLCVPVGVLHHDLSCCKRFQLKQTKKKSSSTNLCVSGGVIRNMFVAFWRIVYMQLQRRVSLTAAELPEGPGGPGGPGGPAMVKAARSETSTAFVPNSWWSQLQEQHANLTNDGRYLSHISMVLQVVLEGQVGREDQLVLVCHSLGRLVNLAPQGDPEDQPLTLLLVPETCQEDVNSCFWSPRWCRVPPGKLTTGPGLPGMPGCPSNPASPLSPLSPLRPCSPFNPCDDKHRNRPGH